jgi:putative nucleotidyltransferase with HDIG domain
MSKKQLLEVVLICLFFLFGAYYFYPKIQLQTGISLKDCLIYILLLCSVLILIILFRKSSLRVNNEIQEKIGLQKKYIEKLNKTYEDTLRSLACVLDCRDHETWGHSVRVVAYAMAIAEKMSLKQNELKKLIWAGFLHDIGKIGVPDSILLKKSKLRPEEWEVIKNHPELGYKIVSQIDFLKTTSNIILYHHERFDGKGYPKGLKGEKIPLTARIFAVADALDAMTSDRPYRPARSMEEAVQEVASLAGEQFCPECTKALLALGINKLHQIQLSVKTNEHLKILRKELEPWQVSN